MKLTVQIKLLPDRSQCDALKEMLERSNSAANKVSEVAFELKVFHRYALHKHCYQSIRKEFKLSAQVTARLLAKVADAYSIQKTSRCVFRSHGSISYDSRILAFNLKASTVSIWVLSGRTTIPFACGDRQRKMLDYPISQSDLILSNGKWFLNVCVDVPEASEQEAVGWIGVDLGLVNLAQDSDGTTFGNARHVAGIKNRRFRQRKRLQGKHTRSANRVLRRLSGREQRFMRHTNHVIAKQIVSVAKRTKRGIALEDLKGIRSRIRAYKQQRRLLHSWAFADLQSKIVYKGRLIGVPVKFVDARNSSRTCPACGHVSKANRKTRDLFACASCGFTADADTNAAREISRRAAVVLPYERNGNRVHVQADKTV